MTKINIFYTQQETSGCDNNTTLSQNSQAMSKKTPVTPLPDSPKKFAFDANVHCVSPTYRRTLGKSYQIHSRDCADLPEFANITLEHTPDPEPTVYEGIPFIWGFGEAWGMLQGYVGVLLEGCEVSFPFHAVDAITWHP